MNNKKKEKFIIKQIVILNSYFKSKKKLQKKINYCGEKYFHQKRNTTKILHPKVYQNYNQVIYSNHFAEIRKKFWLLKIKKQ